MIPFSILPSRAALAGLVLAAAGLLAPGTVRAQEPHAPQPGTAAPADSALAAPTDSAMVAPVDFTTVGTDSVAPLPPPRDPGPLLPPWTRSAALSAVSMERLRPRGTDDILEALPGTSLRVAGDRGFCGFLDLGPIDGGSAEILHDGLPSRSPADRDPGIWDVSAIGTSFARAGEGVSSSAVGGSAAEVELDPPLWGRTLFRTHFQRSRLQTYLRGLSVTTPRAPRTLRLDYEEWKTEDGYDFSNQGLASIPGYGRAKMRRWALSGAVNTGLGRWTVGFGRGRRFHDGTVAHAGSVERWTGRLWTGLDREGDGSHLRVRLYHLDWNNDDSIHHEQNDAERLGARLSWQPLRSGPIVQADLERWSALFTTATRRSHPRSLVSSARAGWQTDPKASLSARGWLGYNYADHAQTPWVIAANARVEWAPAASWWLSAEAGRQPRTPTLLESSGFASFDLAGGFTLLRLPRENLPFEIHEKGRVEWGLRLGQGEVVVGVERWRLDDGIGWMPESNSATDGNALTVGGLSYELDQLTGRLHWPMGTIHHGAEWSLSGHWVIQDLPRDASRGGGWPRKALKLRLSWWHDLFSSYDQIRLFYRLVYSGERYDDLLGVFSDEGDLLPATVRQDLRVALKLRDAEVFLEVHNLTDAFIEEVGGTRRRGRDLLWGLAWPFWN